MGTFLLTPPALEFVSAECVESESKKQQRMGPSSFKRLGVSR
jgi:hypothetical protein